MIFLRVSVCFLAASQIYSVHTFRSIIRAPYPSGRLEALRGRGLDLRRLSAILGEALQGTRNSYLMFVFPFAFVSSHLVDAFFCVVFWSL